MIVEYPASDQLFNRKITRLPITGLTILNMSFSCTLYRIPETLFQDLQSGSAMPNDLVTTAKAFVTFQDSCDAMLFVLKKHDGTEHADLINEIFYPSEKTGSVSDEEVRKLIESFNYKELDRIIASTIYFLSPTKVARLDSLLSSVNETAIRALYDPHELNAKKIYPSLWTSGEDGQQAYNLRHLLEDLTSLKQFFNDARIEKDYILSFSG